MAGQSLIGNLAVNLSLQTAAFQKGATIAEKRANQLKGKMSAVGASIKGFGAALAGSLAVGAVTSAISRGLEYASSLGEVAQQLGVTTKTLQEFRYAATQVGISQEDMDRSLAKLTRSLGELQQGSSSMTKAFGELGLSAQQLQGVEAGDAMRMIADGLSKISDPARRAAIEVDIFGRAGQKLDTLLAGGREGIDSLATAAQKLGVVLSAEQIQKADETADKMSALKQVMEARIAGIVAENSDAILAMADALSKLVVGAARAIGKLTEWVGKADAWLIALQKWARDTDAAILGTLTRMWHGSIEAVSNMVEGVRTWISGKLAAIWEGAKAKIQAVADKFKWLWDVVTRNSYVPDMVEDISGEFDRLDGVMVDPAQDATTRTATAFADMAQSVVGSLGNIAGSIKRGDWVGAVQGVLGIAQQISGIVGGFGGSSRTLGALKGGKAAIGMATGGSFTIAGRGGTDRNLLSINGRPVANVSRGERVNVSPNSNSNGRGGNVYHISGNLLTPEFWQQIQAMDARAALGGAAMAHQQAARHGRRRLA